MEPVEERTDRPAGDTVGLFDLAAARARCDQAMVALDDLRMPITVEGARECWREIEAAVPDLRAALDALDRVLALCESPVNPEYASVSKARIKRALLGLPEPIVDPS